MTSDQKLQECIHKCFLFKSGCRCEALERSKVLFLTLSTHDIDAFGPNSLINSKNIFNCREMKLKI